MATNNRSGNRGGNRRGNSNNNNNPEGRNQYSGVIGSARSNPLAAAAAIGGAVAAGVFLWSRRNLISEQIGDLTDRLNERREEYFASSEFDSSNGGRTQAEIAEEALTLKETGASTPVVPVG